MTLGKCLGPALPFVCKARGVVTLENEVMKRAHFTYFPFRNGSYVYCFTPQVPGTYLISLLFLPEPSLQHKCWGVETQLALSWARQRREHTATTHNGDSRLTASIISRISTKRRQEGSNYSKSTLQHGAVKETWIKTQLQWAMKL